MCHSALTASILAFVTSCLASVRPSQNTCSHHDGVFGIIHQYRYSTPDATVDEYLERDLACVETLEGAQQSSALSFVYVPRQPHSLLRLCKSSALFTESTKVSECNLNQSDRVFPVHAFPQPQVDLQHSYRPTPPQLSTPVYSHP